MKAVRVNQLKLEAKRVYTWLWWSPLLTIPTLIYLFFQNIGFGLVCQNQWQNCDYDAVFKMDILFAVPISALWHLLFLRKAFNKDSNIFVRWHARQALLLTGIRTAIPLVLGLWSGEGGIILAIPILGIVWLSGTSWGQRQAARGDCWLMRRRGLGAELVVYQQVEVESTLLREKLLQNLEDKLILTREYAAVRFGKLEESDEEVVTALQRAAAHDPIVLVREAAQKALQSPAHQKFLAQKSSMTLQGQLETAQPPTNPQIEYEQAVVLLNAGDRDKAVERFAFAFRLGSRNLRVQALAQLESLNEVEVF